MKQQTVTYFKPYEFFVGQKIHIQDGPRKGDWEVVGLDARKVKLQCPISRRVLEWHRFCYVVDELEGVPWPAPDEA